MNVTRQSAGESPRPTGGSIDEVEDVVPDEQDTPDDVEAQTDETDDIEATARRRSRRDLADEAATRRRQLRDVEAERDTLAARVEALQTREVERLAGQRLAVPADLLALSGVTLTDLLDEDHEVDPAAVTAALDDLLATRPGLSLSARPSYPDMGAGRRAPIPSSGPSSSWHDVMRGGRG